MTVETRARPARRRILAALRRFGGSRGRRLLAPVPPAARSTARLLLRRLPGGLGPRLTGGAVLGDLRLRLLGFGLDGLRLGLDDRLWLRLLGFGLDGLRLGLDDRLWLRLGAVGPQLRLGHVDRRRLLVLSSAAGAAARLLLRRRLCGLVFIRCEGGLDCRLGRLPGGRLPRRLLGLALGGDRRCAVLRLLDDRR